MASLVGVLVTAAALAPGSVLLLLVGVAMRRPWLALLLELVWLAITALAAYPMSVIAAESFDRRRENVLLVAVGR